MPCFTLRALTCFTEVACFFQSLISSSPGDDALPFVSKTNHLVLTSFPRKSGLRLVARPPTLILGLRRSKSTSQGICRSTYAACAQRALPIKNDLCSLSVLPAATYSG